MSAVKKHEDNLLHFNKGKKMADKFEKGYVMVSRLYHDEVRPFLSRAAKDVYEELNARITGFNKSTDFVSYSQLQGGKLDGSYKLGRASVSSGLKELIELGVISIISENKKKGNEYQINEVSLVNRFKNKTSSKPELVQLLNQDGSASELLDGSASEHTIDITYRYLSIDIFIKSLRSKKPLEAHFYCFQEKKKQDQLELEKQEAEAKAKAEAERKDKARKLSYDEVIKLTASTFAKLCDFDLWEQYVSSRSMTAKTKLTKNALNTIYKNFQKWGVDSSNESLKTSITGNYQGLFEPKQATQGFVKQSQASTRMSEIQALIAKEEVGHEQYGF